MAIEYNGYGSGDGYGFGYGSGDGYGFGYGYGSGDGSGYGFGDGFGYGSGFVLIKISVTHPFTAYHYIKKDGDDFITRRGEKVKIGQKLHEAKIKMCEYGLHASLSKKDAKIYAPSSSVCTKVLVWGDVIIGQDKLVATDRLLFAVCED